MDRDRPGQREDGVIELADDDLEEPTQIEFGPNPTPTVTSGVCHHCGGPGRTASPMELVGGFPAYCTWSRRKWFFCATKRLVGTYVP